MYCSKCGALLSEGVKFCSNCGNNVEVKNDNLEKVQSENDYVYNNNQMYSNTNNINVNSNNNDKKEKDFGLYSLICGICSIVFAGIIGIVLGIVSIILRKKEQVKTSKGKIGKILGVVGIVLSIVYLFGVFSFFKALFNFDDSNFEPSYSDRDDYDNNNSGLKNETTFVKGVYSREVFSGRSFEYTTMNDTAIFTFNNDSTFEVNYVGGDTYKGTYEVYNGINITVRANEIKKDSTINNNELLANDINNVANKMMETDILNTYLLWLKTSDDILQPFMILYDENSNSGTAVNIFAQVQGTLSLK